jgi:hypothetical protein
MNLDSIQTEPFNNGEGDGQYWQVTRSHDMHAFDNLPSRIRAWMNENFSHLPSEDVLYDFRYTYKGDEKACLSALIADCAILSKIDQEQMAA